MAVFRRRRERPDRPARMIGFELETVTETILGAAEAVLGTRPELVDKPEAVLAGAGPDAFTFAVDTDRPEWEGQLVARTSPPAVLAREAAWIAALGDLGFPVPELVADCTDAGVLVFRPPAGENLINLMTTDLMALPELLRTFGGLHARLHALPVDGLMGNGASPNGVEDPLEELSERVAEASLRRAVDRELAWLLSHRPASSAVVPCHGELHPVHVYLVRGDEPDEVTVNWTRARLGDPTYDVAATLTAFWSAPLYVPNVAQRAMLKMARDSVASAYHSAYEDAAGPLDEAALRYWQAFRLCWLAIHLVDVVQGDEPGPWDPAAGVAQPEKALQDVRKRFWELAQV